MSSGSAAQPRSIRTRTFNPLGGVVDEWHGDGTTLSGSTHTTTAYSGRGLPATLTWQQTTPVVLATASRNGSGLLKALSPGSAAPPVTQTWTHDTVGRVTNMQAVSSATGTPTIAETWTYYGADDPATLVTSRTGLATRTFNFSYDDRHQLLNSFDDGTYSATFTYRDDGRLDTAIVNGPGGAPQAPTRDVSYVYPDPADPNDADLDPEAPIELAETSGPFVRYGFDISGSMSSRTEGAGSQPDFTFVTDGEDQHRMAAATNGDHELYYYDHTGQRILSVARQAGGTITKVHLWFGSLEVEYTGAGAVTQTLAHLALDQPVARIENRDTARRVVHGQLGHFLGAFNPNANALDVAFVYGPFGEILAQSGADPADYTQRFNGKEQDALTSLSYYGFRYFDPLSLTWTQADPLYRFLPELAWDEPRRSNLYVFNLQNPLAFIDPDGLGQWDPNDGGAGAGMPAPGAMMAGAQPAPRAPVSGAGGRPIPSAGPARAGGRMGGATSSPAASARSGGRSGGVAGRAPSGPGASPSASGRTPIRAGGGSERVFGPPADAAPTKGTRTYQTYTKTNAETGEVYTGRTRGTGTPEQNVARRDSGHHKNDEGYGPARLDKSSTSEDAIRGREDQMIEAHGGAKSAGGTSGNQNRGISPRNPNRQRYLDAANKEFLR